LEWFEIGDARMWVEIGDARMWVEDVKENVFPIF